MKEQIIKFISENQLSTSDVADALGRKGHLVGINTLNRGFYRVGEVHYLFAWFGSSYDAHKDLAVVPPNRIIFFDNLHCGDFSLIGHLMTEYAISKKKAISVVVNGNIRDVDRLTNYPVWAKGFNPIICDKKKIDGGTYRPDVDQGRKKYEGSIMVCDDTGVVVIDTARVNQDTYQKLVKVRDREKDWYEKMAQGLSTFEIACSE